ncbi:MAG: CRTAC1 family protein [Acidobacteria bacterium]|nr:CRTAC1 family protein [Acidobacteriota bacterium]
MRYVWWLVLVSSSFAQFSDETTNAGLTFSHTFGETHAGKEMQGGGTVGDFNRDGWPDLFALGGSGRPDALFINQGDGTFVDQSLSFGVQMSHVGVGAAVGDFNNDGWPDLFITSYGATGSTVGPGHHKLLKNLAGTGFVDITSTAGVTTSSSIQHDGFSAAFGDYDLDGDLDLFVTGWFDGALGNCLYRNNGDETFTDVTDLVSIDRGNTRGFSAHFGDMNGDGYPELLVTADFNSSHYYANLGNGTFEDRTMLSGCCYETNGMGGYLGDFNNDGLLDWHITSIFKSSGLDNDGNMLMLNLGSHNLFLVPESSGMRYGFWSWGTIGNDVNHDGWLDIISTNGWATTPYDNKPTTLYINNGDDTFTESHVAYNINHTGQGRGIAHLDADRDGDMEVVIFSRNEPLMYLRNNLQGPGTNWIQIQVETLQPGPFAPFGFGCQVTAHTPNGPQVHEINGNANYLGNSEPRAHFGLGAATGPIQVDVRWPDLTANTYYLVPNSHYRIMAPHVLTSLGTGYSQWPSEFNACFETNPSITQLVSFVNYGACPPRPGF